MQERNINPFTYELKYVDPLFYKEAYAGGY